MNIRTAVLVTALVSGLAWVAGNSAFAQGSVLKLVRYGEPGADRPGLIDASGTLRDLSGHIDDITPDVLSREGLARLAAIDASTLPEVDGDPRLGVPLTGIRQIPALARNFRAHAIEGNFEVPEEPVLFFKAITSLNGPDDTVILPKNSVNSDFEVELGIVMGARASYVSVEDAIDYVAGYTLCEDVTERHYQRNLGGGNSKGKSAPTFTPLGPWLVTTDGIEDVQNLAMWLDLNGERMIDSNTSYMLTGALETVSYLSAFFTLLPGDVICSGTPEGVGAARVPPVYLRPGDVMTLGIDGLCEQRHEVRAYSAEDLAAHGY